ncbi:MAG: hypothetical protein IKJ60_07360 [Ruminococcus sp.]|nr:hypothetical protein [Ruminococcus sp.]
MNDIIYDFAETELSNQAMASELLVIARSENIVCCEYECNQYRVLIERGKNQVIIKDSVSEENGVSEIYTRYELTLTDFIELIEVHKE